MPCFHWQSAGVPWQVGRTKGLRRFSQLQLDAIQEADLQLHQDPVERGIGLDRFDPDARLGLLHTTDHRGHSKQVQDQRRHLPDLLLA